MYMRNVLTGHSNAKAGSASSEGSACRLQVHTFSRWRVTAYAPTFLAGKKALLQLCIFGGLLDEKNTRSRTDSISVRRFALLKEL